MQRVFLDAHVLFSAAYSASSGLRRLWQLEDVTLLTSDYAAEEAMRNLDASRRDDLSTLLEGVSVVMTPERSDIEEASCLPEKDRPILAAAVQAGATHLLTGDWRHFERLFGRSVRGVLVLAPAQYFRAPRT